MLELSGSLEELELAVARHPFSVAAVEALRAQLERCFEATIEAIDDRWKEETLVPECDAVLAAGTLDLQASHASEFKCDMRHCADATARARAHHAFPAHAITSARAPLAHQSRGHLPTRVR